MNVWDRVCGSGPRNFDSPMPPWAERADFTASLLNAIAELSAWAAMVASDLDDRAERARLAMLLAQVERCLMTLRLGLSEAITREAK